MEQQTISDRAESLADVTHAIFTTERIILPYGFTVEVPDQLKDDLVVKGLVKYHNSAEYIEKNYTKNIVRKSAKALEILFHKALKGFNQIPETIDAYWLKALKESGYGEYMLNQLNMQIQTPLRSITKGALKDQSLITPEEKVAISKIERSWPSLRRPPSSSTNSMCDLLDIGYDNAELVSSLRTFAPAFISEWSKVRKKFKDKLPHHYDRICNDIELYGSDSYMHHAVRQIAKPRDINRYSETYGEEAVNAHFKSIRYQIWIEAAITLRNPLLVTYLYNAFRKAHKDKYDLYLTGNDQELWGYSHLISIESMIEYLKQFVQENGSIRMAVRNFQGLKYDLRVPSLCPLTVLLSPSLEEQYCFSWLLGSDRHQISNLMNMRLKDIQFHENTVSTIVQIESYKGRNQTNTLTQLKINQSFKRYQQHRSKQQNTPGENYKRNHTIFKGIKAYADDARSAYCTGAFQRFEKQLDDCHLLPFIPTQPEFVKPWEKYNPSDRNKTYHWSIKDGQEHGFSFFIDLARENSLALSYLLEKYDGISAFIEWMSEIIRSNEETKPVHRTKKQEYVEGSTIGITPNVIAQSSVYASSKRAAFTIKPTLDLPKALDDDSELLRQAKKANHSIQVRQNVYLNRSTDKIKLEQEADFAGLVGEEMVKAASQVADHRLNSTSLFTLEEARKALGMTQGESSGSARETMEILEQARLEEFAIEKTGIISKDGQVIVVKSLIVCALIKAYIRHIDDGISDVFSSNEERGRELIVQRMMLAAILENGFDSTFQRRADEEYGEDEFPFPDLTA